mmetsp:Transcript_11581/g.23313  ORF Transcript_11581/g.23313 Transcript_11581/m.23313 type:complete len:82 (+) Transcript_11581:169-414(+)
MLGFLRLILVAETLGGITLRNPAGPAREDNPLLKPWARKTRSSSASLRNAASNVITTRIRNELLQLVWDTKETRSFFLILS